jgi:hypothetical protein
VLKSFFPIRLIFPLQFFFPLNLSQESRRRTLTLNSQINNLWGTGLVVLKKQQNTPLSGGKPKMGICAQTQAGGISPGGICSVNQCQGFLVRLVLSGATQVLAGFHVKWGWKAETPSLHVIVINLEAEIRTITV